VLKRQTEMALNSDLKGFAEGVARRLQSCALKEYVCPQSAPPSVSSESPLCEDLLGLRFIRKKGLSRTIDSQLLQNQCEFLSSLCWTWFGLGLQ
jgi:hypothetical protein